MSVSLFSYVAKIWRKSGRTLQRVVSDSDFKAKLKVDDQLLSRIKYLMINSNRQIDNSAMEPHSKILPPATVREMKVLQREAFTTTVQLPALKVPKKEINASQKIWKSLQLKMFKMKTIGDLGDSDPERTTHCLIFLDPDKLKPNMLSEEQKAIFCKFEFDIENPSTYEVDFRYENWSAKDIIRAVLPSDVENVTSYSQIGHIAHLNLKPESEPYKFLIGQVLVDKIPSVTTVVNKLSGIASTYRNFQMELLAGEENYVTQTREHNCVYELDFSKVYWNSRLSTEHKTIVDIIKERSVVYDVFAGIGPFAIPLANKKNCRVLANDLNPESFKYLKRNIVLNKVDGENIQPYNLDGQEFIRTVVKGDLVERMREAANLQVSGNGQSECMPSTYIIMNLPATAVDFLDTFKGLLLDLPSELKSLDWVQLGLPHIFCYTFAAKTDLETTNLQTRIQSALGEPLPNGFNGRIVRNVAPNKEMICISFKLWPSLVLGTNTEKDRMFQNYPNEDCCGNGDIKRQKLG